MGPPLLLGGRVTLIWSTNHKLSHKLVVDLGVNLGVSLKLSFSFIDYCKD